MNSFDLIHFCRLAGKPVAKTYGFGQGNFIAYLFFFLLIVDDLLNQNYSLGRFPQKNIYIPIIVT